MRTTDANRPEKCRPDRGYHSALFGPPPLFEGEDPKTYDQFLTEISAAVMPADILAEVLVRDYVDLAFDVLRLRRLKAKLLGACVYKGLIETLEPLVGRSQAQALAQGWAAHNSDLIQEVKKILTSADLTIDTVMAQTLSLKLDDIERIERLIALAEARRNAALREIDRHHQTLARNLRLITQEVEDDQTRVIESKPDDQRRGPWFTRAG